MGLQQPLQALKKMARIEIEIVLENCQAVYRINRLSQKQAQQLKLIIRK